MPFIFIDSRVKQLTCLRQEDAKHSPNSTEASVGCSVAFEKCQHANELCVIRRHVFAGFTAEHKFARQIGYV